MTTTVSCLHPTTTMRVTCLHLTTKATCLNLTTATCLHPMTMTETWLWLIFNDKILARRKLGSGLCHLSSTTKSWLSPLLSDSDPFSLATMASRIGKQLWYLFFLFYFFLVDPTLFLSPLLFSFSWPNNRSFRTRMRVGLGLMWWLMSELGPVLHISLIFYISCQIFMSILILFLILDSCKNLLQCFLIICCKKFSMTAIWIYDSILNSFSLLNICLYFEYLTAFWIRLVYWIYECILNIWLHFEFLNSFSLLQILNISKNSY